MNRKSINIIITFFLLTTSYTAFSQIDSSFFEVEPVQKDPDIPTLLIDTNHYGLKKAQKKGFELLQIIPEPCNSDNVYDKIKSYDDVPFITGFDYYQQNDTIKVIYSLIANCCSNFVSGIDCEEYNGKLDLLIELHEYGYECECFCCFVIRFDILNKQRENMDKLTLSPSLNGVEIEIIE